MASEDLGQRIRHIGVISSNKKNLVIVTAYKPIKMQGPQTAWSQQWILLWEQQRDPDPIKCFCNDLTKELTKWTTQGYDILLMINANNDVRSKPSGMSSVIESAGLASILFSEQKTSNSTV
jgi:hypothetical protein